MMLRIRRPEYDMTARLAVVGSSRCQPFSCQPMGWYCVIILDQPDVACWMWLLRLVESVLSYSKIEDVIFTAEGPLSALRVCRVIVATSILKKNECHSNSQPIGSYSPGTCIWNASCRSDYCWELGSSLWLIIYSVGAASLYSIYNKEQGDLGLWATACCTILLYSSSNYIWPSSTVTGCIHSVHSMNISLSKLNYQIDQTTDAITDMRLCVM